MKQWILEKEGQLKLFFGLIFTSLLFTASAWANNNIKMPQAPNFENLFIDLENITMRYAGISLITSGPILIILSQTALAIREIAINTRKELDIHTEYKSLYWIAIILSFIGWCMIPLGIIMIFTTL